MTIREGKWKCSACGSINLGRLTQCQGCSRVRDPNVSFFLDDDAAEVTDEKLVGLASGGADWTCLFCNTENRAAETRCRQCSAERGTAPGRQERVILDGQAPDDPSAAGAAASPGPSSPAPGPARRPVPLPALLGGGGVVLAVVAALVWFLFIRTDAMVLTAESAVWERSIVVEMQRLVRESDWREQVPVGARELRSWQEKAGSEQIQTGTQKVKTGRRDKGNGFFEDVYEDRPVYQSRDIIKTKVEYEVLRWTPVRTLRSSGSPPQAPAWPAVILAQGEREGPRAESATVVFKYQADGKAREYRYSPPVDQVLQYASGKTYNAKVTVTGIIQDLQPTR
jgi:hypothetical protein